MENSDLVWQPLKSDKLKGKEEEEDKNDEHKLGLYSYVMSNFNIRIFFVGYIKFSTSNVKQNAKDILLSYRCSKMFCSKASCSLRGHCFK